MHINPFVKLNTIFCHVNSNNCHYLKQNVLENESTQLVLMSGPRNLTSTALDTETSYSEVAQRAHELRETGQISLRQLARLSGTPVNRLFRDDSAF
jgi:hypothetical protein